MAYKLSVITESVPLQRHAALVLSDGTSGVSSSSILSFLLFL